MDDEYPEEEVSEIKEDPKSRGFIDRSLTWLRNRPIFSFQVKNPSEPLLASSVFWGALGIVVTLLATYLGFKLGDLRWFLLATFPFLLLVFWEISIRITPPKATFRLLCLASDVGLAALILVLIGTKVPAPTNPVAQISTAQNTNTPPANRNDLSQSMDRLSKQFDDFVHKPRTHENTDHRSAKETPITESSDEKLLDDARKESELLCGLSKKWFDEWNDTNQQMVLTGNPKSRNIKSDLFLTPIDVKYSQEYFASYEHQASDIELRLLSKVGNNGMFSHPHLDYLRPHILQSTQGSFFMASEMQEYCEDLSALTKAFADALISKPHPQ